MGELGTGLGSEANGINNANRTVGRAISPVNFRVPSRLLCGTA